MTDSPREAFIELPTRESLAGEPESNDNFGFVPNMGRLIRAHPRIARRFHGLFSEIMFGEALWAELRPQGVDVCVLSPGFTPTEYQRNAGMGEVEPITGWTSAEQVVDACLRRLGQGPSVVPGWRNRVIVNLMRLLPRSTQAKLTWKVNHPARR